MLEDHIPLTTILAVTELVIFQNPTGVAIGTTADSKSPFAVGNPCPCIRPSSLHLLGESFRAAGQILMSAIHQIHELPVPSTSWPLASLIPQQTHVVVVCPPRCSQLMSIRRCHQLIPRQHLASFPYTAPSQLNSAASKSVLNLLTGFDYLGLRTVGTEIHRC